jgi:hypothetical protein
MDKWMRGAAAGLALGLAMTGPVSANVITFGTGNRNNAYPFMTSTYVGEYQQIYDGALFSGPVNITQIDFFSVVGDISGDYTLHLSTSSATPQTLSTTYANNIGADNALFFSGSVSHVLSFTGTPFFFDPAGGDLLLDVFVNTGNPVSGSLAAGCSTDTNRVFNFNGNGSQGTGNSPAICTPTSYGLETQFTFTAAQVPEPSELALFGTGLLALIGFGAARRRRA